MKPEEAAMLEATRIAEYHFPKSRKNREALMRGIFVCLLGWMHDALKIGQAHARSGSVEDVLEVDTVRGSGPDQVKKLSTAEGRTPEVEIHAFRDVRTVP